MSAFQEYARVFEHLRNLAAWTSLGVSIAIESPVHFFVGEQERAGSVTLGR